MNGSNFYVKRKGDNNILRINIPINDSNLSPDDLRRVADLIESITDEKKNSFWHSYYMRQTTKFFIRYMIAGIVQTIFILTIYKWLQINI
jgi:hypothetical protein